MLAWNFVFVSLSRGGLGRDQYVVLTRRRNFKLISKRRFQMSNDLFSSNLPVDNDGINRSWESGNERASDYRLRRDGILRSDFLVKLFMQWFYPIRHSSELREDSTMQNRTLQHKNESKNDSTSLSSSLLPQARPFLPFLSPITMQSTRNHLPTRANMFQGLFLYPGGLPLSPPLDELAGIDPRPLILFSLDEQDEGSGGLWVNVVEGAREEKEILRRRLWAGQFLLFLPPFTSITSYSRDLTVEEKAA